MTKQESTVAVPAPPAVITCGNCGIEERRILHHVRHRGIFRRLCTTCVLRLHSQNFCPTCFLVYERSPPPDSVTCFKCYSCSHPSCASTPIPSKTPYICPSCVNPNIPIFSLKKVKDEFSENGTCRAIDARAAKILLAGARIAAITMNKAAVTARTEAERRAKEAAFTRKRAREALDNLVYLMAKEKKKKIEKAGTIISSLPLQPRVNGAAAAAAAAMDRMDRSSEVLAALNAVELKEKEKLNVPKVEIPVAEVINSIPAAMEVDDDHERLVAAAAAAAAAACINNENGVSGNLGKSEKIEAKKDQSKSEKNNNPTEQKIGSQ